MNTLGWFGDRLKWGIGVLLLVTAGLIVRGIATIQDREVLLANGLMERASHSAQAQFDVLFHSYAEDLKEESVFIQAQGELSDDLLLQHWITLMDTRWPIKSVHLANEQGEELYVARDTAGWWFMRTADSGSYSGHTALVEGPDGQAIRQRSSETQGDPRGQQWFVQALKDRTGGAVWSSEVAGTDRTLQVAMLIRGGGDASPYRVLAFILDTPSLLKGAIDIQYGEESQLLVNVNGVPLSPPMESGSMRSVQDTLLARWKANSTTTMERFMRDGAPYYGQVIPYTMNGETLQLASVLDGRRIHGWLLPDRLGLWSAALFILGLSGLLIWAQIRQRAAAARLRKQDKHYRTQQRRLAKAIGERDVLDHEVHHRVKNNLQVVSSLLNLQAQRLPEGEARAEFMRGKRRIDFMALVHHKLYALKELRSIKLKVLFTELCKTVQAQHEPTKRNISIGVEANGIVSDPDTAIELGIILCELMQNSLSHGFPYATGGHIDVHVRHISADLFELKVADNGTGMQEQARLDETKMGLEIVEALAQQLDGSLKVVNEKGSGVSCQVRFRMLHPLE